MENNISVLATILGSPQGRTIKFRNFVIQSPINLNFLIIDNQIIPIPLLRALFSLVGAGFTYCLLNLVNDWQSAVY